MTLCVIDGKQCQCQPDEGQFCKLACARLVELERVRLAASRYFERHLVDEADDRDVCYSDEQHEDAKALRDVLKSLMVTCPPGK